MLQTVIHAPAYLYTLSVKPAQLIANVIL